MSHPHLDPLVVVGLVLLALVGVGALAVFGAGARAAHQTTQHTPEVTPIGGNLTRALGTAADPASAPPRSDGDGPNLQGTAVTQSEGLSDPAITLESTVRSEPTPPELPPVSQVVLGGI